MNMTTSVALPPSTNRRNRLCLSAMVHVGHHGIHLDRARRGQSLLLPKCHRCVPLNPFESTSGAMVSLDSIARAGRGRRHILASLSTTKDRTTITVRNVSWRSSSIQATCTHRENSPDSRPSRHRNDEEHQELGIRKHGRKVGQTGVDRSYRR